MVQQSDGRGGCHPTTNPTHRPVRPPRLEPAHLAPPPPPSTPTHTLHPPGFGRATHASRNNRARPGSRASRIQGHASPAQTALGTAEPPLVILASALPWLQCRRADPAILGVRSTLLWPLHEIEASEASTGPLLPKLLPAGVRPRHTEPVLSCLIHRSSSVGDMSGIGIIIRNSPAAGQLETLGSPRRATTFPHVSGKPFRFLHGLGMHAGSPPSSLRRRLEMLVHLALTPDGAAIDLALGCCADDRQPLRLCGPLMTGIPDHLVEEHVPCTCPRPPRPFLTHPE